LKSRTVKASLLGGGLTLSALAGNASEVSSLVDSGGAISDTTRIPFLRLLLLVAVLGLLCWIVYDRWFIRRYEGCDEYPSLASVIPPIQIWDTVAAVTYVAVTFIPVIGSWHTAAGAATIVLALGYQGNPYREGWYGSYDRAYADGYKLGHAERLKNWKPRANQVPPERVAPAYKDHAERLQPIQGAILPISHSVSTKRICPLLYFQPSAYLASPL
jgi:hypothetical protein